MELCKYCDVVEVKTNRNTFCSNSCSSKYKWLNGILNKSPYGWNTGLTKETSEGVASRVRKITGRPGFYKGKTYEEIYGEERGKEMRLAHSGEGNGMFHNTHTKEARACISKGQKEAILSGKFIPMKNGFRGAGFRADLNRYFRSRWEANQARILNYEHIKWEYESKKCRFKLSEGTIYVIDFYLPELNEYVEIKGGVSSDRKYNLFILEYPEINIKIIRKEEYEKLSQKYQNKIINWEYPRSKILSGTAV